ncbi:hypothetical protein HAHE_24180 [Haloferula helveola]|uniref:Prepilin-type N-terminal cleavage/methylation domain-containing protein n=1 Tax=Haloferula helveola TaxID=490095 RepID=A0ABM7REJ1_9BACT|nr:hypothetical protein HAHE_24180 [Haloferula helveola]
MTQRRPTSRPSGVSLLETVIAIGVLAIVIPLALAAMGKAGDTGGTARAESRAPAIAEWCLMELEAARKGESPVLDEIEADQAFPSAGQVIALAFDREGELISDLNGAEYEDGINKLEGERIFYIATLSGRPEDTGVTITVKVEHPAVLPAERRDSVAFHTILP